VIRTAIAAPKTDVKAWFDVVVEDPKRASTAILKELI